MIRIFVANFQSLQIQNCYLLLVYRKRLIDMKERMEDRADSKVSLIVQAIRKNRRRDDEKDSQIEVNQSDFIFGSSVES